jgi:hypothetical protein
MDFERAVYATVCQHAISVVFDTSSSIAARPIRREARRFAVQLPDARPCAERTSKHNWVGGAETPTKQATETANSVDPALRPRESSFAKIGQFRVPMFVNEDHPKTAIFEQNRIGNYPDRAYSISDGLEQSLLLGLQDDLEHCTLIVDK